jgi:hypothetical protein
MRHFSSRRAHLLDVFPSGGLGGDGMAVNFRRDKKRKGKKLSVAMKNRIEEMVLTLIEQGMNPPQ